MLCGCCAGDTAGMFYKYLRECNMTMPRGPTASDFHPHPFNHCRTIRTHQLTQPAEACSKIGNITTTGNTIRLSRIFALFNLWLCSLVSHAFQGLTTTTILAKSTIHHELVQFYSKAVDDANNRRIKRVMNRSLCWGFLG